MAIFTWDDSYSVGLASVDYQHKRLVEMINQLDEAVATGSDETTLRGILKGLYDYTYYHFTTEEEMMRAAGPALHHHYVHHKAKHDEFTDKIRPLSENAPLDSTTLNSALLEYLVHWLAEHILGQDKEMGELIARIGAGSDTAAGESAHTPDLATDASHRNLMGALRESELRFRSLADSVPMLIWISDAQLQRVFFNSSWHNLTTLSVHDLESGRWRESIHPDDRVDYLRTVSEAASKSREIRVEYRLRRGDGQYRWFLESVVPRPAKEGQFIGLIGSAIDITERKTAEEIVLRARDRLEQEVAVRTAQLTEANIRLEHEKNEQLALNHKLQETQNQLLQSEKMASIGQLAAGVAHEINNPIGYVKSNLNALQKYLNTLLQLLDRYDQKAGQLSTAGVDLSDIERAKREADIDFLRDDIKTLLSESAEGVERVQRIVQDLKDFSHVDQAEWKQADINKGLSSTLNIVANELKYKAEVVRDFGDIAPIECLPQQLNQVFMNILVNAAQAIDDHGTITIRTRPTPDGGVQIEISDTGRGIPAEQLNRIFDPFYTTKGIGEGTGLGLSIAYGIVSKHQGRIEVESTVGKGTTFRITLPAHPGSAEQPAVASM